MCVFKFVYRGTCTRLISHAFYFYRCLQDRAKHRPFCGSKTSLKQVCCWTHGVEHVFLASQNTMAALINGFSLPIITYLSNIRTVRHWQYRKKIAMIYPPCFYVTKRCAPCFSTNSVQQVSRYLQKSKTGRQRAYENEDLGTYEPKMSSVLSEVST